MINNWCPECGVTCSGKFCWRCGGETISVMLKCPHCENEVTVIGQFCGFCGKPIHEAIKEHVKEERGRKEVKGSDDAV